MPRTPDDLLEPRGPLTVSLFPGEQSNKVRARVQAYLDRAYADARVARAETDALRDEMAEAFALYKAYSAVYTRMLNEPLTVSVTEKGSHGYSTKQIDGMQALADQYLAAFTALVPVTTSVAVAPGSASVTTHFRW